MGRLTNPFLSKFRQSFLSSGNFVYAILDGVLRVAHKLPRLASIPLYLRQPEYCN